MNNTLVSPRCVLTLAPERYQLAPCCLLGGHNGSSRVQIICSSVGFATRGYPIKDPLQYFVGDWSISRSLKDNIELWEGIYQGNASFQPEECCGGQVLVYREEGTLDIPTLGFRARAKRSYLYKMITSSRANVYFEDGGFFHTLDLSFGMARVEHPCGEDMYHGTFLIHDANQWLTEWQILGPSTNQLLNSAYSRI